MAASQTIESARVLIPLGITLLSPFALWLCRKNINVREGVSFVAAALSFVSILSMVPAVLHGSVWSYTLVTFFPGVSLRFAVDGLSLIFGLVATFLWFFATAYNIGYMRTLKEHAQTRYYFCFALAIFGAVGVAFSGTIVTLYLFYEVITVCTYPLVAHHQDEEGFQGARKYLVYLMGTSKLFLLPAMILTYVQCGTLDFNLTDISKGIFPATANPTLVTITYFLYLFGLAKAALMPVHNWLPSAMVAPTPVSALLHAVAVVKAGVFSVSRIMLSVFGVELLSRLGLGLTTCYLAAFTIVVASVIALTKEDLKARLAYSTVSQLSYIIIGIGMLTPMGVTGWTASHCPPCVCEDYVVLRRRRHLRGHAPQEDSADGRPRPQAALDLRRLLHRVPLHDRHSAGFRFRHQVVPGERRHRHSQQYFAPRLALLDAA